MNFPPNTKYCGTCRKRKDVSEFHKDSATKDGLRARCKECVKKWQQENKDRMVANATRWQKENPEKQKAAIKRWKEKNPEKVKQYSEGYNKTHNWKKENPERNVANVQRRNARIKGNGGSYTAEEWLELCERYDNRCLCCGEQKPLTVDHITPISRGGSNSIDNIQPLCLECNCRKFQKIIDYRHY